MRNYLEELRDERWTARAASVRKDRGYTCEVCGYVTRKPTEKGLQVHHIVYRKNVPLWAHCDEDLKLVCDYCHKALHETIEQIEVMIDGDMDAALFLLGVAMAMQEEDRALLDHYLKRAGANLLNSYTPLKMIDECRRVNVRTTGGTGRFPDKLDETMRKVAEANYIKEGV